MPHLQSITTQLCADTCFATTDLYKCYWKFPMARELQELQSLITPDGVYTPTRILHGLTNAAAQVQSTVSRISKEIRDNLLQWIDDMLVHCSSVEHLMSILDKFFKICHQHNLRLHAEKCHLFLKEVSWCGRIISEQGIRMDPARLNALTNMAHFHFTSYLLGTTYAKACNAYSSTMGQYSDQLSVYNFPYRCQQKRMG